MVNPNIDPRYELARMMRSQRQVGVGVPALGPGRSPAAVQLGRTAANMTRTMPLLHERINAIAAGEPQPAKSVVGKVLTNPVTKTVFKGLEVLSLPGRAVQSTIGEVVDALDGDVKTRGSIADWGKRMKDPTTGFGKSARINTGSKWLDRTIGFIGDVALDPLTYATFGVGKFAGYSGRVRLAGEVLKQTGDEALSAAVARLGRTALRNQPEVLERVGANRYGVYMFGKRLKVGANGQGLRVPMSGAIGEIGEATLAKIRVGITNTRVGKYMQKVTMPKNMLEARIALAAGAGSAEQLSDTVRFLNMVPEQRAATARALQEFEADVTKMLEQENIAGGLEGYRRSVHRFIEKPELLDTASDVERRGYEVWKNWFDGYKERIRVAFTDVDPAAEIKMRENYFPHVLTDEAIAYTKSGTTYGPKLRRVFMDDPFDLPDSFTPRSMKPGDEFFGKILTEEDMDVGSLNRIANEGGFEGEFFETDVVNAAQKYIQDAAKEMGLVKRNEVLRDSNFFKRLEDARVTALEVDEDAVMAARAHVEMVSNAVEGAGTDFRTALKNMVDSLRAENSVVKATLSEQEQGVVKLLSYLDDAGKEVEKLDKAVLAARARLAALVGDPAAVAAETLSDSFPETLRPVLEQFDAISKEFAAYQDAIKNAGTLLGEEGYRGVNLVQLAEELEERAKLAYDAYSDAFDSIRSSLEFSNVLEDTWQRIIDGGRVGGTTEAHEVIRQVRKVLGLEPGQTGKSVANRRAAALDIDDSLRNFIDSDPEFQKVWNQVSGEAGAAGVKKDNLKRMTTSKFDQTIAVASSSETTIRALREAAMYAIARDLRLFRGNMPEAVKSYYDNLIMLLDDAAGLDAYLAVRRGRLGTGTIEQFEAAFGAAERKGRYLIAEQDELSSKIDLINEVKASVGLSDDDAVTTEMLDAFLSTQDDALRRSALLYDIVESGDGVTFGELTQQVNLRIQRVADELENTRFTPSGFVITDSGLATAQSRSYADIVKMRQDILEVENARARVSRRVFEKGLNAEETKQELAGALIQYQAISDIHVKFEAVANILAPHGLVPSEEMLRGIMRTTYQQYGRQFNEKFARLQYAEDVVNNLRNAWAKRVEEVRSLPEAQRPSMLKIFEDVYATFMDSADGDILREVMGPHMNGLLDPATLRAQMKAVDSRARTAADTAREAGADAHWSIKETRYKSAQAKKKWERDYLIPWARTIDPTLRSDAAGPARKILRDYLNSPGVSKVVNPLSPLSDERAVSRWFGQFFDEYRDVDYARFTVGGEAAEQVMDGYRITPGLIRQQLESMTGIVRFFDGMSDGFVNPHDFFRGVASDTPSTYAALMKMHSRRLVQLVGIEGVDGEVTALTLTQARKTLSKTAPQSKIAAQDAENQARNAERILAAFNDSTLTEQELRGLGFTQEMLEKREALMVLEAFKRRSSYAVAQNDLEIKTFLDHTAGIDLSRMDEGIVVRYESRPVYEESISTAQRAADTAKRKALDDEMAKINQEISARHQSILNKYFSSTQQAKMSLQDRQALGIFASMSVDDPRFRQATVYFSRRTNTYRKQFLDEMKALEDDVRNLYQSRRAVIQRQIDDLGPTGTEAVEAVGEVGATQATGTIIRYENVPVFATMPDGSTLKFSSAEWESLYVKKLTAKEVQAVRGEIRGIESRINSLNSERGRIVRLQPNKLGGSEVRAGILLEGQKRLNAIDAEIAELRAAAQAQLRMLEINDDAVRAAGLEKVRILLQGHGGDKSRVLRADTFDNFESTLVKARRAEANKLGNQISEERLLQVADDTRSTPGVPSAEYQRAEAATTFGDTQFYAGDAFDYYMRRSVNPVSLQDFMHPTQSDVRKLGLDEAWRANPSYRVLQNASALARKAAGGAYGDAKRSARLLRKAAKEAAKVADSQAGQWDAVEKSIADAVRGMRESEIAAARAAGAELRSPEIDQLKMFGYSDEDAVAQAVRSGAAIPYTLNGKKYVVPSFEAMFNDPNRYLVRGINKKTGRASKLVEMFMDLRKGGNVALWKDMPEDVRATAGLYALNQVMEDWVPAAERAVKELRGPAIQAKREAANIRYEIRGTIANIEEVKSMMKAWTKDAKTLNKALTDVRRALEVEAAAARRELSTVSGQALKTRIDFFELGEEVKALYGDVDAIPDIEVGDFVDMVNARIERLRAKEAQLQELMSSAPDSAAGRSLMGAKKPAAQQRWTAVFQDWIADNRETIAALSDLGPETDNYRLFEAWTRAQEAEVRFIREQFRLEDAKTALETAQAGVVVDKVVRPFEAGYKRAAKEYMEAQGLRTAGDFNMPSFGVSKDSVRILSNLARIDDAATLRQVGAMLGKYTSFFKAYATLSPGFHVRNSISNFFQMFAAGADVKNMSRGLSLYRSMGAALSEGKTLEQWLTSLPATQQAHARIAADVALALGGGNVDDAFREFSTLRRNLLTDNPLTRGSRGVGRRVEGSARFMLAYDTAVKGGDMVDSFNVTKRFLFDYNDPTILDDTVRHIIPFWTWMSRNLPLQIVNQWQNPRTYLVYNHLARNFGISKEDVVPGYMREQGAFKIGKDTYLSPDLPFTKLNEQIAEFSQPKRLASYLNPAIRLPIELAGNTKLYNNTEFRGNYVPAGGKYLPFVPLLSALGQIEYNQQGEPMMSDKAQYALTSVIPTLGQAERLFPSTDVGDGAAGLRYLGVPIRRVNEDAKSRELERRLRQLLELQQQQKRVNQ